VGTEIRRVGVGPNAPVVGLLRFLLPFRCVLRRGVGVKKPRAVPFVGLSHHPLHHRVHLVQQQQQQQMKTKLKFSCGRVKRLKQTPVAG